MLIIDSINGKNWDVVACRQQFLSAVITWDEKTYLVLACAIVTLSYFLKKTPIEVR